MMDGRAGREAGRGMLAMAVWLGIVEMVRGGSAGSGMNAAVEVVEM